MMKFVEALTRMARTVVDCVVVAACSKVVVLVGLVALVDERFAETELFLLLSFWMVKDQEIHLHSEIGKTVEQQWSTRQYLEL